MHNVSLTPIVSSVPRDERAATLSLLFGLSAEADRDAQVKEMLAAADRGEISLDGLLCATAGTRTIGATLYLPQADGSAFLWPPRVESGHDRDGVVDALLAEVRRRIDQLGLWLGQAIVEPDAHTDREALGRNGFLHLADLYYLERPLNCALPPRGNVAFHTRDFSCDSKREQFVRIVERTYSGTLDCPEFHGCRTPAEALESHRLSGQFDPRRWKIYSVDDEDVGLLLMNEHPAQNAWEVVYMGVVPEARGRGYGRAMLLEGLHDAQRAGRESVLLAVDSQNDYANRIYNELGFLELARRAVHARIRGR